MKLFVLLTILITTHLVAQNKIDTVAIKEQLSFVLNRHQKTIPTGDSSQFANYIDSCNLIIVEGLIEKYGWLGKSFVGGKGNMTVFMAIQHSNFETQKKYLPLLKKSVEDKESRASDLGLLQDHVLMLEGKKQIFGSQVWINNKTGKQELWPIEDEPNVNERRMKVGMEPLEKYAKYFDIEYKLPKKTITVSY